MLDRKNDGENPRRKMRASYIEWALGIRGDSTVINRHGAGVPDRVYLSDHWQDRQSEIKYRKIKHQFAKRWGAFVARRVPWNEQLDKVDMLMNKTELLFLSSGKHVRARNVFRVVRENINNRDPHHEDRRYNRDRRVRSIRKETMCTLGNERAQEYCNYHIVPGEIITLLRVVESGRRLNVLRHNEVRRKEWLLHLCRRAWETSGHKVIGISTSHRGRNQLRKKAGIDTYSWHKLEDMIFRSASFLAQNHVQGSLVNGSVTGQHGKKPFHLSSDTVLVIDGADKLTASQLEKLVDAVQQQEGKLLLVDSYRRYEKIPQNMPLHDVADHLTDIMPLYLEETYKEVARQMKTDINPGLQYPKLENEIGIER